MHSTNHSILTEIQCRPRSHLKIKFVCLRWCGKKRLFGKKYQTKWFYFYFHLFFWDRPNFELLIYSCSQAKLKIQGPQVQPWKKLQDNFLPSILRAFFMVTLKVISSKVWWLYVSFLLNNINIVIFLISCHFQATDLKFKIQGSWEYTTQQRWKM